MLTWQLTGVAVGESVPRDHREVAERAWFSSVKATWWSWESSRDHLTCGVTALRLHPACTVTVRKKGSGFFFILAGRIFTEGAPLNYKELFKGQQVKNVEHPTPSFVTNQTTFTFLFCSAGGFQWSDQVSLLLLKSCSPNTIKWPFCALLI